MLRSFKGLSGNQNNSQLSPYISNMFFNSPVKMEFLSQYESSPSNESSDESSEEHVNATVRSVYLVTYSQADLHIFPDRESFAEAVCEAVTNCKGSKCGIIQWSCCQETHKNGGKQYHMAIKLSKIKRWLPIREYLKNKWNVNVNFSNRLANWHANYY